MYAYVRIPSTKNVRENRKVVSVRDIKKFKSQNPLNPRQLYKIKHNGDIVVGHVLCTANTKSELEAMVAKKRMNVPPSQHLLSPSDSFSTDTDNSPKSAKRINKDLENKKQHRLKQLKERQALCEINAQSVKEYQEQSTCCNRSSSTLIIQIEDLKRTVNAYKVQCDFFKDSLQKEKAEWIAKQTDMEVTIAALEKEVQSLRRLNVELQESAILKGKEIQSFNEDNNLNVVTGNNLTVSNKHPAVGYITPDNKSIHLGYGEYLPKTSYVAAACDCRRPAIFVRQIAICLFSLETLLNSTVTGKGSNRNKNSKQPKNALDCNKILAVKGDWGILAMGAVLAAAREDNETANELIKRYIATGVRCKEVNFLKCGSDEFFVGRTGYLYGALWLNRMIKKIVVPFDIMHEIARTIIISGKTYVQVHNSPCPLMYAYYGTEYLGAAHGLCAILQILIQVPSFLDSDADIDKTVRTCVDYLLNLQTTTGNFPCSMDEIDRSGRSLRDSDDELIHWCHGASGIIYMMAAAYLRWKDQRYLDSCKRAGDLVWRKGLLRKGPGICHGVAGNGYVFLLLYRLTGDERYLYRAAKFADFMNLPQFQTDARIPDSPYSLYEGIAGTACFLADLIEPDKAHFPFQDVF